MKRISIAVQYIVVLGLVGFMLYTFFRPVPAPVVEREGWNNWEGFHAISFAGIDRQNS